MVPRAVVWLRVYGLLLAVGCLFIVVHAGAIIWAFSYNPAAWKPQPPPSWFVAFPLAYGSVALAAALACVVAPWVLPPRPWAWVAGMLMIAAGMGAGPCCWLAVFPMVWLWCETDNRIYFGLKP